MKKIFFSILLIITLLSGTIFILTGCESEDNSEKKDSKSNKISRENNLDDTSKENKTDAGSDTNSNKVQVGKLADVVSVGDYVNYNAASGNGAEKSYTPDESLTGTAEGINTFSSNDTMKWKVMSIDKTTGMVELMAENPTANTVELYGKTGYKNAETVLNNVGEVYGYGEGATGGRSITAEDVNKLENYTPTDDTTKNYRYTARSNNYKRRWNRGNSNNN